MWRVGRRLRLRMPDVALVKYVAPQVWATRPGRARVVARIFDRVMTLFDFETRFFEAEGISTTSVGNPALRRDLSGADPARLRETIGAGPGDPVLLVAPGSRRSEIKRVLPAFEDAAMRLADANPSLRIVVPAADTVATEVKARVAGWRHNAHVVEGERDKLDAMCAATIALACSGTVTTELAVAGRPMVVGYRGHPATALVARAIIRTRFFTLFNIAADEEIAPELLQERCNGPELAAAASTLLADPDRRSAQTRKQTAALMRLGLGEADPFEAAAEVVIDLARERGLIDAEIRSCGSSRSI
jgi:lipid-A-disaccharide synthase